jgi:hypothetical protein
MPAPPIKEIFSSGVICANSVSTRCSTSSDEEAGCGFVHDMPTSNAINSPLLQVQWCTGSISYYSKIEESDLRPQMGTISLRPAQIAGRRLRGRADPKMSSVQTGSFTTPVVAKPGNSLENAANL